jgi:lipoprotein-releasing system ATP-binding protein
MLSANQIKKSFNSNGNITVLNEVSLQINTSEIVSIVGPSGAGKSTLLSILGTLQNPDEGTLSILDKNIFELSEKKLCEFRNQNIGFIFQKHNLLNEFTAIENVLIPAYISKTKNQNTVQKAKEMMATLGLSDRHNHYPNQLSGGEAQRVAVARALINSPKIIFADEPSGNLDIQNAQDLHKLFFDLRHQFQFTFVIVTHNETLAKLSDRILTIKDGKIY